MHVAAVRLELKLADGTQRRRKRRVMDEIVDKLRRHFNVALAEVDPDDRPDRAVLAVASVASRRKDARDLVERVAEAVGAHPDVEVVGLSLREW